LSLTEANTFKEVAVVMGSDSDLKTLQPAVTILDQFGISNEVRILSAHRTPKEMMDFAQMAESNGFGVIIAGAGGAAHLPGMIASLTTLPVIGVPVKSKALSGIDSMYSILQMPAGVPVATVAIEGGLNAGLLATQILAINNSHHMAAMWPETEKLAEDGLVAFACTSYKPAVAPAGAIKPLFGTNPISFAWPRPGKTPVVYDMATASMAMGEVQVAKREGHKVPLGTGLTKDGKETTDPGEIADGGVLLPFGGYKGSAFH